MRGTQDRNRTTEHRPDASAALENGREGARAEDEAKMEIRGSESERKRRLEAKQLGQSGDAETPLLYRFEQRL